LKEDNLKLKVGGRNKKIYTFVFEISEKQEMEKKVFVSGCYDLLHSGHVEFFRQAAQYGDLYVGIGSDKTIEGYKHHKTIYSEQERLFMVKSIRYVKDAFINAGSGVMDFVPTVEALRPDILVVNSDGGNEDKRRFCKEHGIEYVVLERVPQEGLKARSSTDLKKTESQIPTRLDLAGTWIDQPYVSCFAPGWAITISLEPTFEVRERCGLSTSTRNMIKKIWPYQLPNMDPEMLAKLVFCFENDLERSDGIISGAQDSIGICVPGLCRHYYNNRFWPEKIETCYDESILSWLEQHLVMIPMEPRKPGCSVVEGKDITEVKVKALAKAADDCWNAIMNKDLDAFAAAYKASFDAQVAMFPGMVHPSLGCRVESLGFRVESIQEFIDKWSKVPGILAWKMPGAGGGGYLACVVENAEAFCNENQNENPIRLTIRRAGM
jgi:cytidyltransferase-like protein